VTAFDNLPEADVTVESFSIPDCVKNVRTSSMKELIIVQDWVRDVSREAHVKNAADSSHGRKHAWSLPC